MSTLIRDARPLDLRTGRVAGPVDLLIDHGLVRAMGPHRRGGAPQAERVADLAGRVVMPGLWDEHVHSGQWALAHSRFDLSQDAPVTEVLDQVAARLHHLRAPSPGRILQGFGFRASRWGRLPTAADLDRVAGAVPVALVSADLHSVWCSSAALRLLGEGGDGFLTEARSFAAQTRLTELAASSMEQAIDACGRAVAARGVVGVRDMEYDVDVDTWLARERAGRLHHRVEVAVYPDRLDEAIARGLPSGRQAAQASLVAMGPLKVIADGSMSTHSAWCHDPYPGGQGPDGAGVDSVPYAELARLMSRGRAAGLASAVHAIGDHAVTMVLDAFAASGATGSVEHAQLLTDTDVPRFSALGLVASVQPLHMVDDRDSADIIWADRARRTFRFADLLRACARLAFGSDAPVSPVDPWAAVRVAVERTGDQRPPWHPEQAISLPQALLASTRGVAEVAEGAPADLVALDVNPFAQHGAGLAAITSALTMAGGRITHLRL